MANIKIICGGCGIKFTENGRVRHALKTPESGPFECDDAQADRLVSLRVAEYVGLQRKEVSPEQSADVEEPEQPKASGHLDTEELEKMSYNELKALAAERGVVPKGAKKTDYIEAIAAEEIETDDDLPELSVADPE